MPVITSNGWTSDLLLVIKTKVAPYTTSKKKDTVRLLMDVCKVHQLVNVKVERKV